jgi:hypothetical protein
VLATVKKARRKGKVKATFTLEQAMKGQMEITDIALLTR